MAKPYASGDSKAFYFYALMAESNNRFAVLHPELPLPSERTGIRTVP